MGAAKAVLLLTVAPRKRGVILSYVGDNGELIL